MALNAFSYLSEKLKPRHAIFEDRSFWSLLEYDLTHWFSAQIESHLRRFWIDGFIPDLISDTSYGVAVEGIVWIGTGAQKQSAYRFTVSIPQSLLERKNRNYRLTSAEINAEEKKLDVTIERATSSGPL